MLKVDTPHGAAWHRYNDDGYGEHADGKPYDGVGIGRIWPLLAGERGHYELAAGRRDVAEKMVEALEGFANDSGLLSEQVWDSPDIPEHQLFFGRPSGSAMPLVWAHAEYVKLRRSLADGKVFDIPVHSVRRFLKDKQVCKRTYWRFDQPCRAMPAGTTLRIELHANATVHWSRDDWQTSCDTPTKDSGVGLHYADLPSDALKSPKSVRFTFYWPEPDRWEDKNYEVAIIGQDAIDGKPRPQSIKQRPAPAKSAKVPAG